MYVVVQPVLIWIRRAPYAIMRTRLEQFVLRNTMPNAKVALR